MANDAVFLSALIEELKPLLVGARIDKVQQPAKDQIVLGIHTLEGNRKLVMSCAGGNSRFNLTAADIENPAKPPMFCMLLRKYLTGSRIIDITQPGYERIAVFSLSGTDELGRSVNNKIILEMTGKGSNLAIVDTEGIIIDCMKRTDFGGYSDRALLPGMIYKYPKPQDKLNIFTASESEISAALQNIDSDIPTDKALLDSFAGLSPLVCREITENTLCSGIEAAFSERLELIKNKKFTPCMLLEDGIPKEFTYSDVNQYGSRYTKECYSSFSQLLDAFYSRKDAGERRRIRSRELTHKVKSQRDRLEKKIALQKIELQKAADREDIRKNAELITANIYKLKKGMSAFTCEDYYSDGCPTIEIQLDPLKNPQQNSAAMFKEYNRRKSAELHLNKLIAEGEPRLDYLNSVLDELERAQTEQDLNEIRLELTSQGILGKDKSGKPAKLKCRAPLKYITADGFEVLVGRNNTQNDELTFKIASKSDIWLHTQKVHGSHVILKTGGEQATDSSILEAARIAAYYSQAKETGKTAVDYTMVRYVKRAQGALPGRVFYTEYSTVLVDSSEP